MRGDREPTGLDAFIERRGEVVAEAAWLAALATLERAAMVAREGQLSRWRFHPRGEVRKLRDQIATALLLARVAVAFQEEVDEHWEDLTAETHRLAAEAAQRRRREQTLPAERARLEKRRRK